MPRLRIGGAVTDISLHGSVWDAADLLAGLARTSLRSFVPGPWGEADEALASEFVRRCSSVGCEKQCFVTKGRSGAPTAGGCSCAGGGWQYTDDEDVQVLEGCPPGDVWNDARGLLLHHTKVGRGTDDPILCDCDDLTNVNAAVAKYVAWEREGKPMRDGLPRDVGDVRVGITRPKRSKMAHAYMLSTWKPMAGEPEIDMKVGGTRMYVFDPAGRWGMKRPPEDFYGNGEVAVFPVSLT